MSKALPPHDDPPVTDEEIAGAEDADAPYAYRETGRARMQGPTGLAFAISFDVEPLARGLSEAYAQGVEDGAAEAAMARAMKALEPHLKKRRTKKRKPKA